MNVSTITVLVNGWWERWEREWGEGGWMLVETWKDIDSRAVGE